MKQVVVSRPGGPDVLTFREAPHPQPRYGEVVVRVAAVGLNRADILQRRGYYPAPPGIDPDVLGLEFAGVIERVGEGVSGLSIGTGVMGIVPGGAYSEEIAVCAADILRCPRSSSLIEAAAIPEAFITAYDALVLQAGIRSGDRVLVHAAASGVGVAATQLAKAVGATVFGTTRSLPKMARLKEFGVDVPLLATERWDCQLLENTSGQGVDVILDLVGGDYVGNDLRVIANCGRIVIVGLLAGTAASVHLGTLLSKRVTMIGTVMRSRPSWERAKLAQDVQKHLIPLFETGAVRPVVDRVFRMDAVADAHRVMENNELVGCAVLVWN
ncbi:MAG: NAD(P)H-quinone oxidoreductase [Myxococcales bacterium]|nr:NAD(P)H-quinone oxidoreductase [Myxococcales bacterium]